MDNADFFTTLFSWLGADLTSFSDLPSGIGGDATLSIAGSEQQITVFDQAAIEPPFTTGVVESPTSYGDLLQLYVFNNPVSRADVFMSVNSNGYMWAGSVSYYNGSGDNVGNRVSRYDLVSGKWKLMVSNNTTTGWRTINSSLTYNYYYGGQIVATYSPGSGWSGSNIEAAPSTQPFDGQIIGQDAQYDDAGNITDYGNVTVPDVLAPNYTAPGSYGEALNQMNATATTENPAHVDSPTFGQGDTSIKDWVDGNQTPKPDPSDETTQDGFKVEDLEKVFPFCIPWDLYYLLSMFAAEPVAPHIAWPFDFGDLGKFDLDIDLSEFESVAAVVRTCETVLFCVGLAFATRELVRG